MATDLFTQLNTAISIRDSRMLTAEQLNQILLSGDDETVAMLLQATAYSLDEAELINPDRIEEALLAHLAAEYAFAFESSPEPEVVQLFSLRYTYHNLKVLLKEKASKEDLSHLLIPISRYAPEQLRQLTASLTSEYCPALMVDEVAATWAEYLDYQDVRVLDIGMDLAYFKHLQALSADLDHPVLRQLVTLTIDFYNVITVKRSLVQDKPHSFMYQLLSENGVLPTGDYLEIFNQGDLMQWFNQIYPEAVDPSLAPYEEALRTGDISALDLEYLMDLLRFQLLEAGRFETEGPLPLARYLWGKELEIKNLRLLLTGRSSGLDPELLKERMRPVYGH